MNYIDVKVTKGPVVSFTIARRVSLTRYLNETFVQAQIMSDTVLPTFFIFLIVREFLGDEAEFFWGGKN